MTSIGSLIETAKKLFEAKDAAARALLTLEFGQKAIVAQEKHTALVAENDDLKKQIVDFHNWSDEKERYELIKFSRGFFTYIIKESDRGTGPTHAICANCYENSKKSILQTNGVLGRDHAFNCPSCKTSFPCGGSDFDFMLKKMKEDAQKASS